MGSAYEVDLYWEAVVEGSIGKFDGEPLRKFAESFLRIGQMNDYCSILFTSLFQSYNR